MPLRRLPLRIACTHTVRLIAGQRVCDPICNRLVDHVAVQSFLLCGITDLFRRIQVNMGDRLRVYLVSLHRVRNVRQTLNLPFIG